MNKIYIVGISIAVLIAIALFAGFGITGNAIKDQGDTKGQGDIQISLSDISQNAKWYEYDSNGVTIRFFAVKASDGSIKTGFDACDVCYGSKKGYSQDGSYMVCNNCGNRYPISGLGTENKRPRGCWPGYLQSTVNGETLVIKGADLENGRLMFV